MLSSLKNNDMSLFRVFSCKWRLRVVMWFQHMALVKSHRLLYSTILTRQVFPAYSCVFLSFLLNQSALFMYKLDYTFISPLQVSLKMRIRVSFSNQGAVHQDTVQIDSFPTQACQTSVSPLWQTYTSPASPSGHLRKQAAVCQPLYYGLNSVPAQIWYNGFLWSVILVWIVLNKVWFHVLSLLHKIKQLNKCTLSLDKILYELFLNKLKNLNNWYPSCVPLLLILGTNNMSWEVSWAPIALLLSNLSRHHLLPFFLFLSKSQDIPGAPLFHFIDSECELTILHI